MSATSAPAPAPRYPVRWGDTQAGRAEVWVRGKVEQRYDFQGAIERQGTKKAVMIMKDECQMDEI